MSIYYNYALYGTEIVVLSYVDDCVYWYNSEALLKWFADTFWNIFYVNFLGYTHWFMSIRIYQTKDHSVSVDQARYDPSSDKFRLTWTNVHILRSSHGIYFTKYPQTIFQELQNYTNIHSHQHKIKQQFLFHLVHNYNR